MCLQVNNMVAEGRRPEYDDVIAARIGLAGLTWLMDSCLAYEPNSRHSSKTVAQQLQSVSFQLFLGLIALPCQQSVRHVCLVQTTMELWVAVDDRAMTMVLVYDLKSWCLKRKFTINRLSANEPVLCLQVNCMHVTATEVLIGLRGDRNVVAIYDVESYKLTAKITLEEPVFSLSSNESYIFLGMSTGVCLVTSRTKTILSIDVSHSEPVTCVTAVGNEYLWLTAGKCIQIFQVEGNDKTPVYELNSVRFSASPAPFSQIVLHESDIWCISKGHSIVTAWNIKERQKTIEIDCKSLLASSECDLLESAVTCVLPVLDTVWIGTGGGKLFIVDVTSGELITSLKLFDDHVRTLTLIPGPGPCGTEKYYVAVSGRKVQEFALSRENQGKHVCRLNIDVIKPAPDMQTTPVKTADRGSRVSRSQSGKQKIPRPDTPIGVDVQDSPVDYARGSVLMFFEALPAEVMRRMESK
jgi:WD40 repeat protein